MTKHSNVISFELYKYRKGGINAVILAMAQHQKKQSEPTLSVAPLGSLSYINQYKRKSPKSVL